MDKVPMTVRGAETLRTRLIDLKTVQRPQTIREIEIARGHGDLSENAEYHAAREKQGLIEAQIREIESKLSRAEVIDPSTLSGDRVLFGAKVTLTDLETDAQTSWQIVGSDEADPRGGLISCVSPLGRALIGKQVGDDVSVQTPSGERWYSIEDVCYQ